MTATDKESAGIALDAYIDLYGPDVSMVDLRSYLRDVTGVDFNPAIVGGLLIARGYRRAGYRHISSCPGKSVFYVRAAEEKRADRAALPIVRGTASDAIALVERAMEDARSGRLKAVGIFGIGDGEHVTAYTFDDDQPELRHLLARAALLISQQIVSGEHERVPA